MAGQQSDAQQHHVEPAISPLRVLLLTLIGAGLALRLHLFRFPSKFLFDEHHFVENARNYLQGRPDLNDHPPLGKLLIALSMQLFGDTPAGWRAPALLFGLASIGLAAAAARRLFESDRAAWFAAALLSADGFLIAYSRAGLLDGYLTACGLATLLLATHRWTPALAIASGAVAGAALNIKFSGVATLVPLAVSLALAKLPTARKATLAAAVLGAAFVVYVSSYAVGLSISGQPASVANVFSETARLYRHHAVLTDMKNPATSGWISWALPVRPLLLGSVDHLGSVQALSSLGNLAAWWSSVALGVSCSLWILWRGLTATLAGTRPSGAPAGNDAAFDPSGFITRHGPSVVLTLSAIGAFLAPWILTHRDSYIYHFLPSYSTLLLLLAGFLAWASERRAFQVLQFFALVLLVTAFYAPVWSFFEISSDALRQRLFLGGWR